MSRYPQCLKRQKPRLFMNRWNGIDAIPQKYQRCFETIIAKRKGHHTLHKHGKLNRDGALCYFPFYPPTSFSAFFYFPFYPSTSVGAFFYFTFYPSASFGAFCYFLFYPSTSFTAFFFFIFYVPKNHVVFLSKFASMHAKVRLYSKAT